MNNVQIKNLHKTFDTVKAVNGVSFSFQSGAITALCGRNGSGKSTSIKCLLGLCSPDSGEILYNGMPWKKDLSKVGYIPEARGLFNKEKVLTQLVFLGTLKGLSKKNAKENALFWLDKLNISDYRNRKLDSLSKGNQQKIQFIAALIHKPEILILDEPFSGLDPINMQLFNDLLLELKKKNIAILISSHQLGVVENLCEDICIIDNGNTIFSGSLIELKRRHASEEFLYFTSETEFDLFDNVCKVGPFEYRISINSFDDMINKLKFLESKNIVIDSFAKRKMSLQETFINIIGTEEEGYDLYERI